MPKLVLTPEDKELIRKLSDEGWSVEDIYNKHFQGKCHIKTIAYYCTKQSKGRKVILDFNKIALKVLKIFFNDLKKTENIQYEEPFQRIEILKLMVRFLEAIKPVESGQVMQPTQINILNKMDAIRTKVEKDLVDIALKVPVKTAA